MTITLEDHSVDLLKKQFSLLTYSHLFTIEKLEKLEVAVEATTCERLKKPLEIKDWREARKSLFSCYIDSSDYNIQEGYLRFAHENGLGPETALLQRWAFPSRKTIYLAEAVHCLFMGLAWGTLAALIGRHFEKAMNVLSKAYTHSRTSSNGIQVWRI